MSAIILPMVRQQFFDANGNPLASGKVFTYAAGTSTLKSSYTTSMGDVANSNPVILGADGTPNSSGQIWLSGNYKIVIKDSLDNILTTMDNVTGELASEWVSSVGGNAASITLSPSVPPSSYFAGLAYEFIAPNTNSGAVVVSVSALAAKALTKNGSTALIAGDIPANSIIRIVYDGTRFQLTSVKQQYGLGSNIAADANNKLVSLMPTLYEPTATRTITGNDNGCVINNLGAAAPLVVTLPTPSTIGGVFANGMMVGFQRQGAQNITINFASNSGNFNGVANASLVLSNPNSQVILYGSGGGWWVLSATPDVFGTPLKVSNNLSDIANIPAALQNLRIKTANYNSSTVQMSDDATRVLKRIRGVTGAIVNGATGTITLPNGYGYENAASWIVVASPLTVSGGSPSPVNVISANQFTINNQSNATSAFYWLAEGHHT
jgi:hypothetical protein